MTVNQNYNIQMLILLLSLQIFNSLNSKGISIPLTGSADIGYYTVDVFVGTPPKKQSLILDTGSNLMIIPCKGCEYCSNLHENGLFEPN